jgi:hypothetical protein
MAFLVLIIGSVYGFYFKDPAVIISTFAAASSIMAVKTYTASRTKQKEIDNNTGYDGPDM